MRDVKIMALKVWPTLRKRSLWLRC